MREKLGYLPQVNAIRAIAVFIVMVAHWGPKSFNRAYPVGFIGVFLFFVLSGFLITQILLFNKEQIISGKKTIAESLKTFYYRRSLRIFPLYYFVLAIVYISPWNSKYNFKSHIGYFVTYLQNLYFLRLKDEDGSVTHFWTLAIEEQFYLIWPIAIFLVKKENLKRLIVISIVASVISLVISATVLLYDASFDGDVVIKNVTLNNFHAFGIGALFALLRMYNHDQKLILNLRLIKFLCAVSFILAILVNNYEYKFFIQPLLVSFGSGLLIVISVYSDHSFWKNSIVSYLGKISYGLYVYHNFMGIIYRNVFKKLLGENIFVSFSIKFIITVIISSLSWHLLEAPLNRMKDKLKY